MRSKENIGEGRKKTSERKRSVLNIERISWRDSVCKSESLQCLLWIASFYKAANLLTAVLLRMLHKIKYNHLIN